MLVVISGLPGTGKTTLAREVARAVGGEHVRVDVCEAGLVETGLVAAPVGTGGYAMAHVLARHGLRSARHVVVDAVNPVREARQGWRRLAEQEGVPLLEVALVCSDGAEHERRVATRRPDLPGHRVPPWEQVVAREDVGRDDDEPAPLVLDTAATPLHALVTDLAARVRAEPRQATTPAHLLATGHRFGAGESVLETQRLVLRRWRADDLERFAALNADPEVMRHFPSGPLGPEASNALARYADACFEAYGFGLAAVEDQDGFCGFVGLARHRWRPDEVEIGWRLARPAWGRGYATEAARAWVQAAPGLGLHRLVCFVAPDNAASLAVARHLGLVERSREVWDGRHVVVHDLALEPYADLRGADDARA